MAQMFLNDAISKQKGSTKEGLKEIWLDAEEIIFPDRVKY